MHKFVIFECTLLHLSHPLTTTCFVLRHSHLWELYEEASRDRLVYGLFLSIHNWHASMKMVVESIVFFFVAVITLVKPYQDIFQRFLLSLQMAMQLDSLEGHPKVVNVAT